MFQIIYLLGILTNVMTPLKYNKHSLSGCCALWKMRCIESDLRTTRARVNLFSIHILEKPSKATVFHWIRWRLFVFRNSISRIILKTNGLNSLMNYRISNNFVHQHCQTIKCGKAQPHRLSLLTHTSQPQNLLFKSIRIRFIACHMNDEVYLS